MQILTPNYTPSQLRFASNIGLAADTARQLILSLFYCIMSYVMPHSKFNLLRNPVVAKFAFWLGMLGVSTSAILGGVAYTQYERDLRLDALARFNTALLTDQAYGEVVAETVVCKDFTVTNPVRIPISMDFQPYMWVGFERDQASGTVVAHELDLSGCASSPNLANPAVAYTVRPVHFVPLKGVPLVGGFDARDNAPLNDVNGESLQLGLITHASQK